MVTFIYLAMYAKRRICLQYYAGDTYTFDQLASYLDQQATPASDQTATCSAVL